MYGGGEFMLIELTWHFILFALLLLIDLIIFIAVATKRNEFETAIAFILCTFFGAIVVAVYGGIFWW